MRFGQEPQKRLVVAVPGKQRPPRHRPIEDMVHKPARRVTCSAWHHGKLIVVGIVVRKRNSCVPFFLFQVDRHSQQAEQDRSRRHDGRNHAGGQSMSNFLLIREIFLLFALATTGLVSYGESPLAKVAPSDEALQNALSSSDTKTRKAAALQLSRRGDVGVALLVKHCVVSESSQLEVIEVLKEIGPTVLRHFSPYFRDPDWLLRHHAASIAVVLRFRAAVPELIGMRKDDNADVRHVVALSLGYVKDRRAIIALLDMAISDTEMFVRLAALSAICYFQTEAAEAIPELTRPAFFDPPPAGKLEEGFDFDEAAYRSSAATALACIGGASLPVLQKTMLDKNLSYEVRARAMIAINDVVRFHGKKVATDAIPALIKSLDDHPGLEMRAASFLGRFGSDARAAIPVLERKLKTGKEELCMIFASSLLEIDPANAPALAMLIAILDEDDPDRCIQALRSLRHAGPAATDSLKRVIVLLDHEKTFVRVTSAELLQAIGPEAAPALPALLKRAEKETDARVQREITLAINAIRKK